VTYVDHYNTTKSPKYVYADIANALRVPVWDIAAFAKALLGA
jgi:hypothetical protein